MTQKVLTPRALRAEFQREIDELRWTNELCPPPPSGQDRSLVSQELLGVLDARELAPHRVSLRSVIFAIHAGGLDADAYADHLREIVGADDEDVDLAARFDLEACAVKIVLMKRRFLQFPQAELDAYLGRVSETMRYPPLAADCDIALVLKVTSVVLMFGMLLAVFIMP